MKIKTCEECGREVVTVERASGGYVEILAAPSAEGDLVRLNRGKDVGKFLKVSGPLLDKAQTDRRVQTYLQHACSPEGLF